MTNMRRKMKLAVAAMIRNENDVIMPFLHQCAELFDEVFVADVRSTDGTREVIRAFKDERLKVRVYDVNRQEKYQGALMDTLSRAAFSGGADWVFFLDADEFLDIHSRAELESYLQNVGSDVLVCPWINMIPTVYGTYQSFDPSQNFYWSGRASQYNKIALSLGFAAANPDYFLHEGNHQVAPAPDKEPVGNRPGLPILHVPIRSLERFRAKIDSACRMMESKHNRGEGEGSHVFELNAVLSGQVDVATLNSLAAHYGDKLKRLEPLHPEELGWPVKGLPPYVVKAQPESDVALAGLARTLKADTELTWDLAPFVKGNGVSAVIDGEVVRIVPLPLHGDGRRRQAPYKALGQAEPVKTKPEEMMVDVITIAPSRVKFWAFSSWCELIPVMNALFVALRPRRYVELGVHNGMSFFAACQVSERLNTNTECVAVDSWVGDEHAGFHDTRTFDDFRAYIGKTYPNQQYIQSYFAAACGCFEDGSVDLLHIDGLHTYEAVKEDFETWLPKMSSCGVIIFHDTNVHERGFGVWRLWHELKDTYPAFNFAHRHGLGIIYVGTEPHPIGNILRDVAADRVKSTLAQGFFESIGELVVEHRTAEAELETVRETIAKYTTGNLLVELERAQAHEAALIQYHTTAEAEIKRLRALEEATKEYERTVEAEIQRLQTIEAENSAMKRELDMRKNGGFIQRMLQK